MLLLRRAAIVERRPNREGEILQAVGLLQEARPPPAEDAVERRAARIAGEEEDREVGLPVPEPRRELGAVHLRHGDVGCEQVDRGGRRRAREPGSGPEASTTS